MYFGFSEDQLLFQSAVRDFLAKECPPERLRDLWQTPTGRSRELWKQLAELGLPGLWVPESCGGLGMDALDAVLPLEETGRAGLAEPLVGVAVGAPLLVALGEPWAQRWLPAVASGDAVVAVGHPDQPFVADAHVADLLLLPHGDEVHAVERAQAEIVEQPANDPARRVAVVRFDPGAGTCAARGDRGRALWDEALDRGALACAAQQIGVADRLIEMAVSYAKQREQFGRPIGSFQAVKHQLADAMVQLEYARPVVHRAAYSVAHGAAARAVHVSHAKLAAGAAAERAARTALQVHGAIGYTWEQDLHIWMRRAWSLALDWGLARQHRERVARWVLAPEAPIGPGFTFSSEA